MAKLVTTTCKPKIVLNDHSTSLCKVGGKGLYTGYHSTRKRESLSLHKVRRMLHLLEDFKIKLPAVMYTIQRTILKIQSQQKSESLEQFKRDLYVSYK